MFDPERDIDPGPRRFYQRLLAVIVITIAGCVALFPSVSSFSAGLDNERGCLAIKDGWHADRGHMSDADKAAESAFLGTHPTSEQRRAIDKANAIMEWVQGPGACVPESRHRLIESGLGLGTLALICCGVARGRRTRTNLRRSRAEHEDVDAGSVREVLV